MSPLLETRGLEAFYGDFQALFGIDFSIGEGETIAIIGANGAGKTTMMRAITGMLAVVPDQVMYRGAPIGGQEPFDIVKRGIAMVPEGRQIFPSLTVEENLLIGAEVGRQGQWVLSAIYDLFPVLAERRRHGGMDLSGGQQQMVAIGRALMANPYVLLCDELSLGLAPIVIRDIYAALPAIKAEGTSVIVVEQDIRQALAVADRVYCLQEGRVSLTGSPDELDQDQITAAYFGLKET